MVDVTAEQLRLALLALEDFSFNGIKLALGPIPVMDLNETQRRFHVLDESVRKRARDAIDNIIKLQRVEGITETNHRRMIHELADAIILLLGDKADIAHAIAGRIREETR